MDLVVSVALVLAVCAIGLMVRVRTRGRVQSFARVERDGGSRLIGKDTMNVAYGALEPVVSACVRAGISSNAVTWASLGLALLAGALAASGHFGFAAAALVVASIGDALDGQVARASGTASAQGEILDAVVDRYSEFAFLGGVAFHFRANGLALVLTLLAILASTMVSYSSSKAEALAVTIPRGSMRRPERALLLCAGAAFVPIASAFARPGPTDALPLGMPLGDSPLLAALVVVAVVGNISAIRRFVSLDRALASRVHASPKTDPAATNSGPLSAAHPGGTP